MARKRRNRWSAVILRRASSGSAQRSGVRGWPSRTSSRPCCCTWNTSVLTAPQGFSASTIGAGQSCPTWTGRPAGRPWPDWVADNGRIVSVARLVRRYDDAAQGSALLPVAMAVVGPDPEGMPASRLGSATFVGHLDSCPENVFFRDGQAAALIDFDLARAPNRFREVCAMLLWWAPMRPAPDRESCVREVDVFTRAALLVDVCGLATDDRSQIVRTMINSTEGSWYAMRYSAQQRGGPWQRLWDEGVGDLITRQLGLAQPTRRHAASSSQAREPSKAHPLRTMVGTYS